MGPSWGSISIGTGVGLPFRYLFNKAGIHAGMTARHAYLQPPPTTIRTASNRTMPSSAMATAMSSNASLGTSPSASPGASLPSPRPQSPYFDDTHRLGSPMPMAAARRPIRSSPLAGHSTRLFCDGPPSSSSSSTSDFSVLGPRTHSPYSTPLKGTQYCVKLKSETGSTELPGSRPHSRSHARSKSLQSHTEPTTKAGGKKLKKPRPEEKATKRYSVDAGSSTGFGGPPFMTRRPRSLHDPIQSHSRSHSSSSVNLSAGRLDPRVAPPPIVTRCPTLAPADDIRTAFGAAHAPRFSRAGIRAGVVMPLSAKEFNRRRSLQRYSAVIPAPRDVAPPMQTRSLPQIPQAQTSMLPHEEGERRHRRTYTESHQVSPPWSLLEAAGLGTTGSASSSSPSSIVTRQQMTSLMKSSSRGSSDDSLGWQSTSSEGGGSSASSSARGSDTIGRRVLSPSREKESPSSSPSPPLAPLRFSIALVDRGDGRGCAGHYSPDLRTSGQNSGDDERSVWSQDTHPSTDVEGEGGMGLANGMSISQWGELQIGYSLADSSPVSILKTRASAGGGDGVEGKTDKKMVSLKRLFRVLRHGLLF